MDCQVFVVNNIKLNVNASLQEAFSLSIKRLKKHGLNTENAKCSVFKRSVDARHKNDIHFVYAIAVSIASGKFDEAALLNDGISVIREAGLPKISYGNESLAANPLVVGAGPCGLFAALLLAENGYNPIIIERGSSISERKKAVENFYRTKALDTETNIQFGAGGAGTFSDGKLVTRINDPFTSYVLKKLVEFGAPEEILYIAKPHIGTDVLSQVVDNLIARINALGGSIFYNTKYIDTCYINGLSIARTTKMDIPYGTLILAVGHSARDTYESLIQSSYAIEAKPFSVGMRIEHIASEIDASMYGNFAGNENLGHAEYNLSYNTKERGVYTFCMCPGGEVVAAASEEGGLVVNGMSYHARNGINSNSAVVCSIFKEDYGATPTKAIDFQRKIEKAAYRSAGGNYTAPIITVGDFLKNGLKNEPSKIIPTYMNSSSVRLTSPRDYLPSFVLEAIQNALLDFDKKIHGFAADYAVLTGAETRTSAPIRILRDFDTRLAKGKDNIYPAGEGAGYAGGITSAACDGVRTAIAIMNRYKALI